MSLDEAKAADDFSERVLAVARERQTLPGAFSLHELSPVTSEAFRFAGIDHARTPLDGNKALANVQRATLDHKQNVLSRIYRWVMHARWSVLHCSVDRFATEAQMGWNSVKNLNTAWTGNTWNSRDSMQQAYRYFSAQGIIPPAACEQLLGFLEEHHLTARDEPRLALAAWYRSVGYEVGFDVFDRDSGLSPSAQDERQQRTVPGFLEVQNVATGVYSGTDVQTERLAHAEKLWRVCTGGDLLSRGFSPGHIRSLQETEIRLAREHEAPMGVEHLYKHLQLPRLLSRDLQHARPIGPDGIARLSSLVLGDDASAADRRRFGASFPKAEAVNVPPSGFQTLLSASVANSGATTEELADWLEVRAFSRGNRKLQRRNTLQAVRLALKTGVSFTAPVGVICACTEPEAEQRQLIRQEHRTMREPDYLRRFGNIHEGAALSIDREWYGITVTELLADDSDTAALSLTKQRKLEKDIVALETRQSPLTLEQQAQLRHWRSVAERIGQERCQRAVARREATGEMPDFDTIGAALEWGIREFPGEKVYSFRQHLEKKTKDPTLQCGVRLLYQICRQEEYPALPIIRQVLKVCRIPLTEKLKRDWHQRFPIGIQNPERELLRATTPLARILSTLIFRDFPTIRVAAERMGVTHSPISTCLNRAERGEKLSAGMVERILDASGASSESFVRLVVRDLCAGMSLEQAIIRAARQRNVPVPMIDVLQLPGVLPTEIAGIARTSQFRVEQTDERAPVDGQHEVTYHLGTRATLEQMRNRIRHNLPLFMCDQAGHPAPGED